MNLKSDYHDRPNYRRVERTGWRDAELSERHGKWGSNCPAVDLDFLMVEYNLGVPVAIVEYKFHRARMPNLKHPTYRALCWLCDKADLPFLIAFYWKTTWAFAVYPVNDKARDIYGESVVGMSEREFVTSLYRVRALAVREQVLAGLNTTRPPHLIEVA